MTEIDLEAMAKEHFRKPDVRDETGYCGECGEEWPCDVYKLAEEYERLRTGLISARQETHSYINAARDMEAELAHAQRELDKQNRNVQAFIENCERHNKVLDDTIKELARAREERDALRVDCHKVLGDYQLAKAERDSAREALGSSLEFLKELRYAFGITLHNASNGRMNRRLDSEIEHTQAALSRLGDKNGRARATSK